MYGQMERGLTFTLPVMEVETIDLDKRNFSLLLTSEFDDVLTSEADPKYEQFLADVWVGVILTLIVLSCVCCMCSCLLYHKFQQWKRSVLSSRNATNIESGNPECESLPSYTIASGLPSYTEALEQLRQVKELVGLNTAAKPSGENVDDVWVPHTPPTPAPGLSVAHFLQIYRSSNSEDSGAKS